MMTVPITNEHEDDAPDQEAKQLRGWPASGAHVVTERDPVLKIACTSGTDVFVGRVNGGRILDFEESEKGSGPLWVDCPTHGKFLGFFQMLPRGAPHPDRATDYSVPIFLFPLNKPETLLAKGPMNLIPLEDSED